MDQGPNRNMKISSRTKRGKQEDGGRGKDVLCKVMKGTSKPVLPIVDISLYYNYSFNNYNVNINYIN